MGRRPAMALALAAGCALAPATRADCFDEAAAYQHVNPAVLRAIAWQESHGRADALHRNDNGSLDYGIMQINSIHQSELKRWGIAAEQLMQPCVSCLLYTSPSPRDRTRSRMPSSA